MPTWPATLPQTPHSDGFMDEPQDNTIRSKMAGLTKQRPRFTATVSDVSEKYRFTFDEFFIFKSFYEVDLKFGAILFDKPDPLNGGIANYQFTGPYKMSTSGPFVTVTINLERLP